MCRKLLTTYAKNVNKKKKCAKKWRVVCNAIKKQQNIMQKLLYRSINEVFKLKVLNKLQKRQKKKEENEIKSVKNVDKIAHKLPYRLIN